MKENVQKAARNHNWESEEKKLYRFVSRSYRLVRDTSSHLIMYIKVNTPRRLTLTRCLLPEPFIRTPVDTSDLLKRKFTILGKSLTFEEEIDWEVDFNGGRWPILGPRDYSPFFGNDYSLPIYRQHGDVKRVWDFNKHIHFVDLAGEYCRTHDETINAEVCSQLKDWIEKHPYPKGMGWYPPLIVAQRAISWIIAWNLGCLSPLYRMLAKSLFIHGCDLTRRLEISSDGVNSNHLIGNLAALYLIGRTLSIESWQRKSLGLLLTEIDKQILPDGVDYEQSSSYHRYVLEFLSLVWLANDRGPSKLTEKIRAMIIFLKNIALPDHTLPLLSDQDGARVWVHDIYKPTELLSLLPVPPPTSRAFSDSGYYVMRYGSHVLVFDCGPIGMQGKRLSTHGHSDLLSFTLSLFNRPFIVDIGSGTYTENKEIHDYFRSTAGHNTITVNGKDQCGLSRTWTLKRHPSYWLLEWSTSNQEDSVCGAHDGFYPLIHERRITMEKLEEPAVRIRDKITGAGKHEIRARMHLHPDVEARSLDSTRVQLSNGNVLLDIEVHDCFPPPSLTIEDGLYCPDYGQTQKTRVVELLIEQECPMEFSTRLTGKRSHRSISMDSMLR